MHDINTLDKLGIPGVIVATTEFMPAAASQAKSLGFEPAIKWVPHPIQNRTKDELAAIADAVYEPIMETLRGTAS